MKFIEFNSLVDGKKVVVVLCYIQNQLIHVRVVPADEWRQDMTDIRGLEIREMAVQLQKQNHDA